MKKSKIDKHGLRLPLHLVKAWQLQMQVIQALQVLDILQVIQQLRGLQVAMLVTLMEVYMAVAVHIVQLIVHHIREVMMVQQHTQPSKMQIGMLQITRISSIK